MNTDLCAFVRSQLEGEPATHLIVRFSGRLAALLFVAGSGHAPHRALPDDPKTVRSGVFNRGIKVDD